MPLGKAFGVRLMSSLPPHLQVEMEANAVGDFVGGIGRWDATLCRATTIAVQGCHAVNAGTATASFSGLQAATSCQKGTNTNTTYTPNESTPLSPRISERALHSLCERALHSLCVCVREISLPHVRSSCEIDRMRGNGAGTRRGTLGAPERGARFGGDDGYLGSCIDDERSKSRKVVWHATYRESSTLRTQSARI